MKITWLRLCTTFLLLGSGHTFAEETEGLVKAAFLYRFCAYITWPEQSFASGDSPLVIGVVGSPKLLADVATTVSGRECHNRDIALRSIRRGESLEGIHILYIGEASPLSPRMFLSPGDTRPILTVTDSNRASSLSVIDFTVVDRRVRFDVSVARAREIGLELSADLLAVARRVVTEEQAP